MKGRTTMNVRRSLGAAGVLALGVSAVVAVAPAAHAASGAEPCIPGARYLHVGTCDGLDPAKSYNQNTGKYCSAGAWTVHSEPAFGGTLELRWGPNCETNWTRFTPSNNDEYGIWVTRLDDGVWAGHGVYGEYYFEKIAGVPAYGDQVYSPGPAAACVADITRGGRVCYNQSS